MKLAKEERIAAIKQFSQKLAIAQDTMNAVLSIYDGSEITGDIAPDCYYSLVQGERKNKYSLAEISALIEIAHDTMCTDPTYEVALETLSAFMCQFSEFR